MADSHRSIIDGAADEAWYESPDSECNEKAGGSHPKCSRFTDLPPAVILEVFKSLDARDLSVISCVCSLFRRLSYESQGWKDFYYQRWGQPDAKDLAVKASSSLKGQLPGGNNWRRMYLGREARSRAFLGRFQTDSMHGHTAAVRSIRVLAQEGLVFTAGYDSVLRVWSLEEGLPIACSRSFECTLRAIAVDSELLVVAGTDAKLRVWRAVSEFHHRFDISEGARVMGGHEGPVSCLGLDTSHIYSGSWDMTVRAWDRSSLRCLHAFPHADWVWSLASSGHRLFATAGADLYTWHTGTRELIRVRANIHTCQAYTVACSLSGHHVFTGGSDGAVRMFNEKAHHHSDEEEEGKAVALWKPHSGAVLALAYADPWLVSASEDGSVALMDVRSIIKKRTSSGWNVSSTSKGHHRVTHIVVPTDAEPPQRMLLGFHRSFYAVDVGCDRVVGGGEGRIIRVWDFSQALEIEQRVQASRSVRLEQRLRRKQAAIVQERKGDQAGPCNIVAKRDTRVGGPVWQRKGGKVSA